LSPTATITEEEFAAFQTQLAQHLQDTEPFCAEMDECAVADFQLDQCQPAQCPFVDKAACRYLTACLTEQLQHEYAEALNVLDAPPAATKSGGGASSSGGGFSWGL